MSVYDVWTGLRRGNRHLRPRSSNVRISLWIEPRPNLVSWYTDGLKSCIGTFAIRQIEYLVDRGSVAVIYDCPCAGRLRHLQSLSRDIDRYDARSHLSGEHDASKSNRTGTEYRYSVESRELQLLQSVKRRASTAGEESNLLRSSTSSGSVRHVSARAIM